PGRAFSLPQRRFENIRQGRGHCTLFTGGTHSTRDLAFSPDGKTMFVSVGSYSNVAEQLPRLTASELQDFEMTNGLGAAWGYETDRADVLVYDPEGREKRTFATGLRNCSGMTVQPATGEL